jgi:MFS family permease
MKRNVPMLIAIAAGLVMVVGEFVPPTRPLQDLAGSWFNILAAVAFVLGGANLVVLNLRKISDNRPGWGYAAVTLAAFFITLFIGLSKWGVPPADEYPDFSWSGAHESEGGGFWWVFEFVILPLQSSMFALLAFFVASAAFRAFRAKNTASVLLLGTAFIILLGRTYAGSLLSSLVPETLWFLRIDMLSGICMSVFNLAGSRAIMIGVALGIMATSLRILTGTDKPYLGQD